MLAVDRRLSLKNNLQETVADLWSTTSTEANRSAFLRFYNQAGNTVVQLSGYNGGSLNFNDANGNYRGGVYSGTNGIYFDSHNSDGTRVGLLWVGGNKDGVLNLYKSDGTNTIVATGHTGNITCVSLTQTSSRKVKDNIKPLTSEEANKILLLEAVTFDYKDKEQGVDRRGFIAEEVKDVIPQVVTDETENTPASLDYIELIPYLQAVVKEQAKIIQDLKERIEALEQQNSV